MKRKNIIVLIAIGTIIGIWVSMIVISSKNYKETIDHKTVVINNEEIEIETCPYCGSIPDLSSSTSEYSDSGMYYTIECDNRMDSFSHVFQFESEISMKDVIERWNNFAQLLKDHE